MRPTDPTVEGPDRTLELSTPVLQVRERIRPDVAVAMVRLGTDMGRIRTALDLDEGLEQLGVSPR